MPLFIETIKVEGGILFNIDLHQKRFDETRKYFFSGFKPVSLSESLLNIKFEESSIYKLRVTYGQKIEKIEYEVYIRRDIQKIRVVEMDDLDYSYKFLDRSCFDKIDLDYYEEAIIVKNGFVTDSRFSNLVFFDGLKWVTPDTFLLNGTKRQYLLNNEIIKAVPIKIQDLSKYSKVSFVNSMLDIGDIVVSLR